MGGQLTNMQPIRTRKFDDSVVDDADGDGDDDDDDDGDDDGDGDATLHCTMVWSLSMV